jgi:hypothetical protein
MGTILAEFMEGVVHVPVTFVNTDRDSGSDKDFWVVLLPIDGIIRAVRTKLSGFQYKTDLRQIAMAMLSNPGKLEPLYCDVPQIEDSSTATLIVMAVPVVPVGTAAASA